MTMEARAIQAAARHLHALQAGGQTALRQGHDLQPQTPTDGWQIQRSVSALRAEPVVGWKCGRPLADRWVAAALHQAMPSGARVRAPAGANGLPCIEPELAFVLQRDLLPRDAAYTQSEVDAAIGQVRLAVEVLGCRYADANQASGPELMADGLWHQTLVLGPTIATPLAAPNFTLAVEVPGQVGITLPAHHADGDPRLPLYWLAEFLRQQGVGLLAGQVVITGSLAGVIELPYGQPVVLRYGDLGSVTLSLDPL